MSSLVVSGTTTALWWDIIHDAEIMCEHSLENDLESYLVFLLARYIQRPDILKNIIALEFLKNARKLSSQQRQDAFTEIGDKCLIFSGLFPDIADKRLVKISYFVNMGKAAYTTLSTKENDLYHLLASQFVPMMDVLQTIRLSTHADLLPLQAYELWNDTGSKRAFKTLKNYTSGTPFKGKMAE
jgi:hypothetical protein